MNDKNFIKKIQNDLAISKPKIINNNDNISLIKKNFNSKYTEDISDSDEEDLTSYKNRNVNIINKLGNKTNNKKSKKKKINKKLKEKKKKILKNNK